ncbi:MAG: septum site-determining protein MinC [Cyanobacteria bacterium K_Offshore_surface_m2_239]|nr:septum site-determining protein MinC [Cyanobacteria bacterium K_Offshore_surface_m2_239]
MAAEWIPSVDRERPHLLKLPPWSEAGDPGHEVSDALLVAPSLRGAVTLLCGPWPLRPGDFRRVQELLAAASLSLWSVWCQEEGAKVAAASLGLVVDKPPPHQDLIAGQGGQRQQRNTALDASALSIHQGTVRSGDHPQATGSLLVLGDVNPGAQVSATGHVMVWGKLRGIAHAGRSGDRTAQIVALHLHPLQLRIADQVARGPEEPPPHGLAEKAHLVNESIQIDPADPSWPLGCVPAPRPGLSSGGQGTKLA